MLFRSKRIPDYVVENGQDLDDDTYKEAWQLFYDKLATVGQSQDPTDFLDFIKSGFSTLPPSSGRNSPCNIEDDDGSYTGRPQETRSSQHADFRLSTRAGPLLSSQQQQHAVYSSEERARPPSLSPGGREWPPPHLGLRRRGTRSPRGYLLIQQA